MLVFVGSIFSPLAERLHSIARACGNNILLHREQKNRLWKRQILYMHAHTWQKTKWESYNICSTIAILSHLNFIVFHSSSSFELNHSFAFFTIQYKYENWMQVKENTKLFIYWNHESELIHWNDQICARFNLNEEFFFIQLWTQ